MKFGKRVAVAAIVIAAGAVGVRAALQEWVQHVDAGPVIAAFFRDVSMPGGTVPVRRPPAETRPALTKLINASPSDATLYRLRAREDELALDFIAAEADWKAYAKSAPDPAAAHLEVADFYHRRIRPKDELAELAAVSRAKDDPLLPATEQRAWRAFERMESVIDNDGLPAGTAESTIRAWVARYSKEPAAYERLIDFYIEHKQFAAAEREIAAYGAAFHDPLYPIRARAALEVHRGAPDAAIRIYDQAFEPLWPEEMTKAYFQLLEKQGKLRDFVGRARSQLLKNPRDLSAASRLVQYFAAQQNTEAARRALIEYRSAKESTNATWTAEELETTAELFGHVGSLNDAARMYYALYSLPNADPVRVERALYGITNIMLRSADAPVQFGSGDLSLYKDIAAIDNSPGFLNGILSLILNGTGPKWSYNEQNRKARAYFHRAAASELTNLLEQRFPRSSYRAPLRAGLIAAYAAYGDDDAVIQAGRAYLTAFPKDSNRLTVAMSIADALARRNRTEEELALYDRLLRELGANALHIPLGNRRPAVGQTPARGRVIPFSPQSATLNVEGAAPDTQQPIVMARSVDYVQVLDRYLSRLAALNRPMDALRVYRTEIDRNPNDPGLYERLSQFLDQAHLTKEVEDTYRKAIERFPDRSWYHKLARWYLREQQSSALEAITREVVKLFSGAELEQYFSDVVGGTGPILYRQLNLYAHDRFPEDLVFIHNLLNAYRRTETFDPRSAEALLRQYWFYDPALKSLYFGNLASRGRLYAEIAEVRKQNPDLAAGNTDRAATSNPAAAQFASEAEAWLSHFEAAAPVARSLAAVYAGDRTFTARASALYRSIAAYDPKDTDIAAQIADIEYRSEPRDRNTLAKIGDIYADREQLKKAEPFWNRMPQVDAGKPDGYLDAATVFWDYYKFGDALRLIADARKKFDDATLFAYQAGAIYENKRDYARAVDEYLHGALGGRQEAQLRLLRLATRRDTRDLVDRATAAAAQQTVFGKAEMIRVAVLEAQQRRPDLERLLDSATASVTSSAALDEIAEVARRQGFDAIETRALERQIAITTDPVDKIRLTIALARVYEAKQNVTGGARVIDALYRDNPTILGVVRAATDYHVRNAQRPEAVTVLLDAAGRARADLAKSFTLEAARIAADDGRLEQARELLARLLSADPYRPEYLTAMADTYLRAKDDKGFRDYQLATLKQLKESTLSPVERTERMASIRRALIPALARLAEYPAAIDQYIEVINRYPDDEALTKEGASFAVAHGQTGRMVDFYRKTTQEAPRDYRWPIVLGRIETIAENYPAAISDYDRAMKIRPDRPDVLEAKARLEERLIRFDDAAKSYAQLYELAYRNPQWLVKAAEMRARLGQTDAAISALKTAIIGAHTETDVADFEIAQQLESWHILPAAVEFAERGAALAGAELFTDKHADNAAIYARIMMRARRMDAVLNRLGDNTGAPGQVIPSIGQVVAQLYTPEEKARFERVLTSRAAACSRQTKEQIFLPVAASAQLAGLQAQWRYELMVSGAPSVDQALVRLQSDRGVFEELAQQMRDAALQFAGKSAAAQARHSAVQAYIAVGDIENQMAVMKTMFNSAELGEPLQDRYLALLARLRPSDLLAIAARDPYVDRRNRAVQIAIASDKPSLAYDAVKSRGGSLAPVWTKAYTALTGVYYDDRGTPIGSAFRDLLDDRSIGERVKTPAKINEVVAGNLWFYYGARFGEYLASTADGSATGYLPSSLEAAPGSPNAYLRLGDYYADAGRRASALAEYEKVLELDRDRGDAHDHAGRVLWSEGKREAAIARWRSAIAAFERVQSRGVRVPEAFWNDVTDTFSDIGQRHLVTDLRADMQRLLADYIQRNGAYQLDALIEAAAQASVASGQGITWLLDLTRGAQNPEGIISALMTLPDLSAQQRIGLQRERVAYQQREADAAHGDERTYLLATLARTKLELISMLLDAGDTKDAASEWNALRHGPGFSDTNTAYEIDMRLASRNGSLAHLLEGYQSETGGAPNVEALRDAARAIERDGDKAGALMVLEYLYDRELRTGHLEAANFLGLADVKLQRNAVTDAVSTLRRMALVTDDPFETLLPAADVLDRYGKNAEASEFIEKRIQSTPWDAEAKIRFAATRSGAERTRLLVTAVTDEQASYATRAKAAERLRGAAPASIAGTELGLLASTSIDAAAAEKPLYLESRLRVAANSPDPETKLRLYREALAIAPADERARLGVLQSALKLKRDSLALSTASQVAVAASTSDTATFSRRRHALQPSVVPANILPGASVTPGDRTSIAVGLADAAERLDDPRAAEAYLQAAILTSHERDRGPLQRRIDELDKELARRAANAAHQPVVRDVIEQDHPVRPMIARNAQ